MHPDDKRRPSAGNISERSPGAARKNDTSAPHESRAPVTTPVRPVARNLVKQSSHSNAGTAQAARRPTYRAIKCHGPVILICIVMVLFIIAQFLLRTDAFTGQNPYIALVVVQFFVFILPCAFVSAFGNHRIGSGLSQYNLRLFSPRLLGFLFSSLAVMLFGNMVIKYLGYILFGAVNSATVVYEHDNMFALIAATVLVPAITEEILLRGVIFTEYEKRGVGAFGAIVGSAVLFAFIHFDIKDFISYLFAGIILAVTVHVTRSLLAPIIVHLMNNTICLFTDTFLKRVSKESISSFFVFFLLMVLLLLALFAFFESLEWISNAKADSKAKESESADTNGNLRLIPVNTKISSILSGIFMTPAFIVVIILYILEMIIFR